MKLGVKTLAQLALTGVAAATLAACASHPPPPPAAPIPPPSADNAPPPQSPYESAGSMAPGGPLPGSARDFVVNVGDTVYFDLNQSDIRAEAQAILAGQSNWLRRYGDVKVRIEGNCDERGTREYNFALGARRADAVRTFLISHGVAQGRITTISYGKEQPLDPGHDEAAWAKNRNAHTTITEDSR
jgi:peptidoglycan-associated lipoprotein